MQQEIERLEIENQIIYFKSSESMLELREGSVDVIITSPPYNRKKNYSSDTNEVHNDNLPENEYLAFLKQVWTECLRVASEKAVFFLNIGDSANDQGISDKVVNTAIEAGWHRIQDIIWIKSIYGKGHYTPTGSNKRLNNVWEHIFVLVKNIDRYELNPKAIGIPYADKSNIGRYGDEDLRDPGNVWHVCYEITTGATIKKGHDAPFPIGLPYQCIKLVPDAKLILDPFLGTGTSLGAALNLGISGIGYEKYPRKELIKSTVLSGREFNLKPTILIPHYEISISLLERFLENANSKSFIPRSKKDKNNLQILIDTLEKLNIQTTLITKLKKGLASYNAEQNIQEAEILIEKKKGITLDQFIENR